MVTSKAPRIEFDGNAVDVRTDEFMLRVRLAGGRAIAAPLEFFPRLRDATPDQHSQWEIIGGGYDPLGGLGRRHLCPRASPPKLAS